MTTHTKGPNEPAQSSSPGHGGLVETVREIASQMHNLPRSATADRVEAIARAALSMTQETGWLIESKDGTGRPRWWGEHNADGLCDWTFDSLKAIRFCRKIDAERAIATAEWIDVMREECVATDHAWLDPKAEGGVAAEEQGFSRHREKEQSSSLTSREAELVEALRRMLAVFDTPYSASVGLPGAEQETCAFARQALAIAVVGEEMGR